MATSRATCLFADRRLSARKASLAAIRILGTVAGLEDSGLPKFRQSLVEDIHGKRALGNAALPEARRFVVEDTYRRQPFENDHEVTRGESAKSGFPSDVGTCRRKSSILAPSSKVPLKLFPKSSSFADPRCFDFFKRFNSEAEKVLIRGQELDFPGPKVQYSTNMNFIPEARGEPIPCYRLLYDNGQLIDASDVPEFDQELCLEMYHKMVSLQIMDTIFYEAQRQGRISFYVTTIGEEAINVASAAALAHSDVVHSQYREAGVLMWRGFTLQQFAHQCFGNDADYGKGRQMPAHYGSKDLNFYTVSSPIATQIPQAVGAAYSLKMDKEAGCAVTYFGDGASSEGDFHAAMNFAAVLEVPLLFICRNNGWAISTPTSEQFRSDGVVVRGQAYGIRSLRVDGNDALAVYSAIKAAREMVVEECRPLLIEALTYRVGHHSTSDDSSKYRSKEEIEHWRVMRDPVARFRTWLEHNGWWSIEEETKLRADMRGQMMSALQDAEQRKKPPLSDLFEDVYDSPPKNLKEQERQIRDTVKRYPKDYPSDVPLT